MPYDEQDYSDYPDERDPWAEAAAARDIADAMRAEEDKLAEMDMFPTDVGVISPGPGMSYDAGPMPVSQPWTPELTPLERMQARDQPGSRTIMMTESSPYSQDALIAQEAQRRYEAGRMYDFYVNNGMDPAEAMAETGIGMFGGTSTSTYGKPMTAYQRAQVERWNKPQGLTPYQQAQVSRWERQDASKRDPLLGQRIRDLGKEIRDVEQSIAQNPRLATGDQSYLLSQMRAELADLMRQYNQQQSRVAAPAPAVTAPSAPSPFAEGQIVRSRSDPSRRFRIVNGKPVPL